MPEWHPSPFQGPLPAFINKVLLKYSHVHLFMSVTIFVIKITEILWFIRAYGSKPKIFTIWLFSGEFYWSLILLFSHSVMSDSLGPPWTAAYQASLSFTISQSLLKLISIESMMPSNNLILCCPLLLLPSIFPSIRVFSNESALHIMWPKFWSFSFSICPSKECTGLISFRIDWFELLAVHEVTKKSITT